ncbi:MAG: ABC transporter substrate-binding protein [Bacteroidales bacterium]|nr:ABC transporter substrate-binding protein [Bacteroidales bacterium]
MKKSLYIFIMLVFAFVACNNQFDESPNGKIIKNDYAKGFEISEISEGYIIKIKDRLNNTNQTYNYLLSSKNDFLSANTEIIQIPVSKVVCLSTTHCAFITQIDKASTIKGVSGANYVFNDELRSKIQLGEIAEIGYDSHINLEKIISLNPDVVFAYGVDNSSIAGYEKLRVIGIPFIFVSDFLENTPLGRMEWIKFFACFFDNLDYANEYFDSVKNNYNNIKENIVLSGKSSPEIILNLPWKGTWWVPGADSYMVKFIKDAGGTYNMTDKKDYESVALTVEEIFAVSKNIDFWLNPNAITKKSEILNIEPRLVNFTPVNDARIFNNNKRLNIYGGNDFFESGITHPDIILKDLYHIFYGIDSCYNFYYYQEIN